LREPGLLTCSSIAALRLSPERAPRKLAHHFSGEPVYASRCRCGAIVVQCNSRCLNPSRNVDPDFHRDPLRRTARDVGAREPFRLVPFRTQPALTPMRDSRVAHRLRPTDPPRLTSWKSLESPTNPLLTSRVALQAPPSDSKSDGSSSRFLFQDRAPF
jgi:hypothetical protein